MTQLTTRLQGISGLAAIVAFLAGVPAVLLMARTTPWTTDWGIVAQRLTMADNGTLLITFLGTSAWLGWAYFAVSLIAEAIARIRGTQVPHLRGFALPQTTARRLFDLAALAFIAVPSLSAAASAPAQAAPVTTLAQSLEPAGLTAQPAGAANLPADGESMTTTSPAEEPSASLVEYTVRRGDTLWRIAEQQLGDGHRWSDIHRLNRAVLGDDPDFITPGTVLLIPNEQPATHEPATGTHLVQSGDTLSQIAADALGDPARYPDIFEASKDITQPNGERLTDPHLIKPGWIVDITPGDEAAPAAEPSLSTGAPATSPSRETNPPVLGRTVEPAAPPTPPAGASPGTQATSPSVRASEPREGSVGQSDVESAEVDVPLPAWFVPGLAGASAILGAGVYLTVRAHRRTRLRFRTPGHVIAPIPAALVGPDETARAAGGQVAHYVEALDRALRALASAFLDPSCYPPLVAVELTGSRVTLHLAEDVTLPAPWAGRGRTWSAPLHGEHTGVDMIPPYPMLVSVGQTDDGTLWLLNLEHLGTLAVHGEPGDVKAFARHIAAELAVGPWSFLVNVHVLGLAAEELTDFNSGRVTHTAHGDPTPLNDLTAEVESSRGGGDWDPDDLTTIVTGLDAADRATVQRLATAIRQHASRPGVAVVALNADPIDGAVNAQITPGQRFHAEVLDIDVQAALLTAQESVAVAELVAVTDTHENIPMPVDQNATEGIQALVDAGGAIRREYVQPRPADHEPAGPGSLLPDPATAYAAEAPLTVDDVRKLAPAIPDDIATRILAADPHLDRDLDWWTRGSACPVPRLQLLGRTDIHGLKADLAVSERKQHFAELAAFLWTHPDGVRSGAIAQAFGCSDGRARTDITNLRAYFGERHVPKAPRRNEPGFEQWHGYHLRDVLIDVDLFRRLRARGTALGARSGEADGVACLARALRLVHGEPFTDDRSGSWAWMHQSERIDHEIAAAIVDTALLVVAATLHADPPDLDSARLAAQAAIQASPYDEPARLALAEVEDASGNPAEADRLRRDNIFNRTDDRRAPLDPPQRTACVGRVTGQRNKG